MRMTIKRATTIVPTDIPVAWEHFSEVSVHDTNRRKL
jgi:hypothetical protein